MPLFKPKKILNRFDELDINELKQNGFKAIFIDIDNTITAPGVGCLTDEAKEFIEVIKASGIKPIIFSNNTKKRVMNFVKDYDVEWHYFALKPLPFSFIKVARNNGFRLKECAVLGDQLLTDILGANLSNCYGIYTKQLQDKDTPLTKINRRIEKIIWRFIDEKM